MKLMQEIKQEINNAEHKKEELEKILSKRMTTVVNKEIELIKEEYGAVPKIIEVQLINSRELSSFCDTYIMKEVVVKI